MTEERITLTLAWLSMGEEDDDFTYHVSLNCPQYPRILLKNANFAFVEELPLKFKLCCYCNLDDSIQMSFTLKYDLPLWPTG